MRSLSIRTVQLNAVQLRITVFVQKEHPDKQIVTSTYQEDRLKIVDRREFCQGLGAMSGVGITPGGSVGGVKR